MNDAGAVFGEEQPYPGLRSFLPNETDIFFGRETHVAEMVDLLGRNRFMAVTGTSGSGKSSLVRTGLCDALARGVLARAGSHWVVADFRPGLHPRTALAEALLTALDLPRLEHDADLLGAELSRGPLGLAIWLRGQMARMPSGRRPPNLLLLVDQFEELFRYAGENPAQAATRDEADGFVRLLLASAEVPDQPIYVVLTMRSDFLGECAEFAGLAEKISRSQFLTPRLTRAQLQQAIEGPAAVFGGQVEPALVTRLLNDMGTIPDQLPLMQHAMMRLWGKARAEHGGTGVVLTLDAYLALGGINGVGGRPGALSSHADEVLRSLTSRERTWAEQLFRALAQGDGSSGRDVRRPVKLADAAAVAGVDWQTLVPIVEAFRAPGVNLLTPPPPLPLAADSVIDVSHESLIRQWTKMRVWAADEAESARIYTTLEAAAKEWRRGDRGLLQRIELGRNLDWRQREQPNAAWARRYGDAFPLAMEYLETSRLGRQKQVFAGGAALLVIVVLVGSAWLWQADQSRQAAAGRAAEAARQALAAAQHQSDLEKQASLVNTRFWFAGHSALQSLADGNLETARLVAIDALDELHEPASGEMAPVPGVIALSQGSSVALANSRDLKGPALVDPGGNYVAVAVGGDVRMWDGKTGAELRVLRGLRAEVTALVASGKGDLLAAGSAAGEITVWSVSDGVLRGHLPAGKGKIKALAFAPDGGTLVIARADAAVPLLWKIDSTAPAPLPMACNPNQKSASDPTSPPPVDHPSPDSIAAGDGGKVFAVDSFGMVSVWRDGGPCPDRSEIEDWKSRYSATISAVDWVHEAAVIVARDNPADGGEGGNLLVYKGFFHPHRLRFATWSTLESGLRNVWMTTADKPGSFLYGGNIGLVPFELRDGADDAAAAPKNGDSRTTDLPDFAVGSTIGIRNFGRLMAGGPAAIISGDANGLILQLVPPDHAAAGPHKSVTVPQLSPHGRYIAALDSANPRHLTVHPKDGPGPAWEIPTADQDIDSFDFGGDDLLFVEFKTGDSEIVERMADGTTRVRALQCATPIPCDHGLSQAYAVRSDGSAVVAGYNGYAIVWDTAQARATLVLRLGDLALRSVGLLADHSGILTLASDGRLRRWREADGILIDTIEPRGQPSDMVTADQTAVAATRSDDGTIDVFDFASQPMRHLSFRLPGVSELSLAPDGRTLMTRSAAGNAVGRWNIAAKDVSLFGFGTLPTGATLAQMDATDAPPNRTPTTEFHATPVPADLEIFVRRSALRDMTPQEITGYAWSGHHAPRQADPLANRMPCNADLTATGNQSCLSLLHNNALDPLGWRGLAARFEPPKEQQILNLPNPAIVVAAAAGDAASITALADWLRTRGDSSQMAAIGELRRVAWEQDPRQADSYVAWMLDVPDLARAQVSAQRAPLETAARTKDPLSLFALGMLVETDPPHRAEAFLDFQRAADAAPAGSKLRAAALEREGSLARVLGPEETIRALAGVSQPINETPPATAGSKPGLPWTRPDLQDIDPADPGSIYRAALRATDAIAGTSDQAGAMASVKNFLRLAESLQPGLLADDTARQELVTLRPSFAEAFQNAPSNYRIYRIIDAILERLAGLISAPCNEAVNDRSTVYSRYRESAAAADTKTDDFRQQSDRVSTALMACGMSPTEPKEAIRATLAAAQSMSGDDQRIALLAERLLTLGSRQDAVRLLARRYTALQPSSGSGSRDDGQDLDMSRIEQYRDSGHRLAAVLPALDELPDAETAFAELDFSFVAAGRRLLTEGQRDNVVQIYTDAVTIRSWLAARLSPQAIRDKIPVWGQIAYAYDWWPSDDSTPAGVATEIDRSLAELDAAEHQEPGKDVFVPLRRSWAVMAVASSLLDFRGLSDAPFPPRPVEALAARLDALNRAVSVGNTNERRNAASAYYKDIIAMGGIADPTGPDATSDAGRSCDRLATYRLDPERARGPGVMAIDDPTAAAAACRAAVLEPGEDVARMQFQLGRALSFAGRKRDALLAYKAALLAGDNFALAGILDAISSSGDDIPETASVAREYARRILLQHGRSIGGRLLRGDGAPKLPAAARTVLAEAMAWGDPGAAADLAALLEIGAPGVSPDPRAALRAALMAQEMPDNPMASEAAPALTENEARVTRLEATMTPEEVRQVAADAKRSLPRPDPIDDLGAALDRVIAHFPDKSY